MAVLAIANAFVVLGILDAGTLDEKLETQASKLKKKMALPDLDLSLTKATFWLASTRGPAEPDLKRVPLATAACGVRFGDSSHNLSIDWATITPVGIVLRNRGFEIRHSHGEERPVRLSYEVTDNFGHSYSCRSEWSVSGGPRQPRDGILTRYSMSETIAEPYFEGVEWLEFRANNGESQRVPVPSLPDLEVGKSEGSLPTPAETYLDWLFPPFHTYSLSSAKCGTLGIVMAVADALLAVGALEAGGEILQRIKGDIRPAALPQIPRKDPGEASNEVMGQAAGLAVRLPLEHAFAVLEGIRVSDDIAQIHLYGYPWTSGNHWPVDVPCLKVIAVDDLGIEYVAKRDQWKPHDGNEANGTFTLWPPLEPRTRSIKIIVRTLWESAWVDVPLPGRN
jgi:hypothetical protein